jgi:hypothetical protein
MAGAGRFDYHYGFKAGQNRCEPAARLRRDGGRNWKRFDILFLVSVMLVEQQAGRS